MAIDKSHRWLENGWHMQSEPIFEAVMRELRSRRIPQRRIADEAGIPYSTLQKIAQGQIKEPSVHAVQKLYDYFRKVRPSTTAPERKAA